MAKMSIMFNGFADLAEKIDAMGKDIKPAVEEALTETQKLVQTNLDSAAEQYRSPNDGRKGWAKGNLYKAIIKNPRIEWEGNIATVRVGFSRELDRLGFWHSIFVMYGVPFHGKFNHGYAKDTKIYNAIKGTRTKNRIKKLQRDTLERYMK